MIQTTKKSEPIRIDADLKQKIKSKGIYGETFSDILRRLLHEAKTGKAKKSKIEDKV